MRVRWGLILGLAAIFSVGAMAGMVIGNFKNGLYYSSGTEMENLIFADRKESPDYSHYRGVALVPPEYGKLIAVTGASGGETLFWYEDEAGVVRNIPVDSKRLLSIRREGKRSS